VWAEGLKLKTVYCYMGRFDFLVKGGLGLSFAAALLATASCEKPLKDLSLDFVSSGETAVIKQGETLQLPFSVGEAGAAVLEVEAVSDNADYAASVEMSETDAASGVLKVTAPKYILAPVMVNVEVSAVDAANSRTVKKNVAVSAVMADNFQEVSAAANTYIVKPGAFVKFPAANSNGKIDFASAALLWQDKKGMVADIIADPASGSIYVSLNPELSGNAVVAASDADKKVVWSWTLWVADYDPAAKTMDYTDKASGASFSFMDRYLGAVSAEPGTDAVSGNFYQWGRKDAFPGSTLAASLKEVYDIEGNVVEYSVEPCAAENNIPNAVANPFIWYSGVSGGNWGWISNTKAFLQTDEVVDLWGGKTGKKSVYDPCPDGWQMPALGAYAFYQDADVEKTKYFAVEGSTANKDLLGRYVKVGGDSFFFPAQGEIPHGGNYCNGAGSTWPCGKAWSSTSDPENCRAYGANVTPTSAYTGGFGYGYGFPVRCVKVK